MVVTVLAWALLGLGLIAAVARRSRLESAGVALGMGLGGFIDGIVLHQLLQWHNLFSSQGGVDRQLRSRP